MPIALDVPSDVEGRPGGGLAVRRWAWDDDARTLGIYAASRLIVLLAAIVGYYAFRQVTPTMLTHAWDSYWYLHIAAHGYPTTLRLPHAGFYSRFSPWAFLPLFPLTVRAVAAVLPIGVTATAYLLNLGYGAVAALVLRRLAVATTGQPAVANRAVLLFCFWPGAVVMSLAYSEALFLLLAAGALLALARRRWLVAGMLSALASATRPTGLALLLAAVVASAMAIASRREWASLVAPILAPVGFLGFLWYGERRTGQWDVWQRAEQLWHQRFDLNRRIPHSLQTHLAHRDVFAAESLVLLVSLLLLLAVLALLAADRFALPASQLAYVAGVVALMFASSGVSAKPRFVLAALPLFVVAARHLRGTALQLVVALFAGGLGVCALLYLVAPHVVP